MYAAEAKWNRNCLLNNHLWVRIPPAVPDEKYI